MFPPRSPPAPNREGEHRPRGRERLLRRRHDPARRRRRQLHRGGDLPGSGGRVPFSVAAANLVATRHRPRGRKRELRRRLDPARRRRRQLHPRPDLAPRRWVTGPTSVAAANLGGTRARPLGRERSRTASDPVWRLAPQLLAADLPCGGGRSPHLARPPSTWRPTATDRAVANTGSDNVSILPCFGARPHRAASPEAAVTPPARSSAATSRATRARDLAVANGLRRRHDPAQRARPAGDSLRRYAHQEEVQEGPEAEEGEVREEKEEEEEEEEEGKRSRVQASPGASQLRPPLVLSAASA